MAVVGKARAADLIATPIATPRESSASSEVAGSRHSSGSTPAAASPRDSIASAVSDAGGNPVPVQKTLRERIVSVFSNLFSSIARSPCALVGYVKSFFSYIGSFFSRSTPAPQANTARDLGDEENDVKLGILAQLSKKDEARFIALAESDNDQAQVVMDQAVARYNKVLGQKQCLGQVLTDENREQIALGEAAKTILTHV